MNPDLTYISGNVSYPRFCGKGGFSQNSPYSMSSDLLSTRCLILACGNTLRGDDGVGPWLAEWAEDRFFGELDVRVISRQQWTPELAEDIAAAESVIFVDCCTATRAGSIDLRPIAAAASTSPGTHQLGGPELLALAGELYGSRPREAFLLTVGAGSTALGEEFSGAVQSAVPEAAALLGKTVRRLLATATEQLVPQ